MTLHDAWVDEAKAAIRRVHEDTAVTLEDTLESLTTLREEILMLIGAIEEDIRRRDRA